MKNVVFFANSTWCIGNFRFNLMRSLLSRGCRVHVIAPLDPTYDNSEFLRKFRELGVNFHSIPLSPRGLNPLREISTIVAIFKLLRSIRPDVVLSYTVKCNLYAGFSRQILGFEQVANVPGLGEVFESRNLVFLIVSTLYRIAFRGMSVAFFQNSEDLKYCLDCKLVPKDRCILIPGSGVDLNKFKPAFPPRASGKRIFLMFGRVLPQKGYLDYLAAADQLKSELGDNVEFWVMGIEDRNRPDSTTLYAELLEADVQGKIRLIPAQVDVLPILEQVDAVVLPSRYNEGIPRSLLEAMAMGKVIITTDWRGCRDTVEDGQNGLLIPVKDVTALAQAMKSVAEMDDLKLRRMGKHSRTLVEQRYDEDIVLREYLRVTVGDETQPQEVPAQAVANGQNSRSGIELNGSAKQSNSSEELFH